MMTRLREFFALAVVLALSSATAHAEVALNDPSELYGLWKLESVSPGISKPKIAEDRTWEFRADGVIVTSGYNRIMKGNDRYEWKYKLLDGKIQAEDPGRPGKPIDYVIYEKSGNTMILKGGLEGYYFFTKQ